METPCPVALPVISCPQLQFDESNFDDYDCLKKIDGCTILFVPCDALKTNGRTNDFMLLNQLFHLEWTHNQEKKNLCIFLKESNHNNRYLFVYVESQYLHLRYFGLLNGNNLIFDDDFLAGMVQFGEYFFNEYANLEYGYFIRISFVNYGLPRTYFQKSFSSKKTKIPNIKKIAKINLKNLKCVDDFQHLSTTEPGVVNIYVDICPSIMVDCYFTTKQILCNVVIESDLLDSHDEMGLIILVRMVIKTTDGNILRHLKAVDFYRVNENWEELFKYQVFLIERPENALSIQFDAHILPREKISK